jgi:hypothetical protein
LLSTTKDSGLVKQQDRFFCRDWELSDSDFSEILNARVTAHATTNPCEQYWGYFVRRACAKAFWNSAFIASEMPSDGLTSK